MGEPDRRKGFKIYHDGGIEGKGTGPNHGGLEGQEGANRYRGSRGSGLSKGFDFRPGGATQLS